ncbi:uncharacterized protein LOC110023769 isoform X2 [Phalaenopsis equestris]|uniref:uncharacterized protein LOC110023769 isoform X2 n=1 Tax=Phalaenopsis equestris TaxID=78828 RepID=UPI0009E557D2|nr:uncharacterized protein LOC110023769 isoform X2 [Phalaenopsis equestris]
MCTSHLCISLLGAPTVTITRRNSEKPIFSKRNKKAKAPFIYLFLGQNKQSHTDPSFSLVNGKRVNFPLRNSCTRSLFRVSCIKEQFRRKFFLARTLVPLFKDGLQLVRLSMFLAAMFAVGIFIWYGQKKARSFIEVQLLPSVSSVLSGYLQREIEFGKVLSVSPLGFTVETSSIGPHQEEFSCGEASTMKIRVCPFASLRKGRIVINTFLSHPNILVSQKEDFSFLGIPSPSESGLHRRRSSEEGMDYRTKTRRLARAESISRRSKERVKAAKEAAEKGYIVPQRSSDCLINGKSEDDSSHSRLPVLSGLFNCMDDNIYCKDNHSRSVWAEYDSKHADLEKSFGVRSTRHGEKFWSKTMLDFMRHRLTGITWKRVSPVPGITVKQRNLQRSAAAARAYLHGLSHGKSDEPCTKQRVDSSHGGCEGAESSRNQLMNETADNAIASKLSVPDNHCSEDHSRCSSVNNEEKKTGAPPDMDFGGLERPSNINIHRDEDVKIDNPKNGNCSARESDDYKSISRPFTLFNDNILSCENFLSEPAQNIPKDARYCDNGSFHHGKFRTFILPRCIIPGLPVNLIFNLFRFILPENQTFFNWFNSHVLKLESYSPIKTEDIAAELTEEIDQSRAKSIEKVLPVIVDSVYFKGGTLMLLGYGDREPREMVNCNGYVKFQNHYRRVHVQLSGDCRGWRTDNSDGGQLTTLVFVDTTEQKWHANLKISNLFAPLFERIFDIPIIWYQGRATGEVHLCMSKGDIFPNIHGQLDVTGISFQIYDAPSIFSEIGATLCFRGQRVFLHNAGGYFGDASIEASGDFGLNPEFGEFHLMCQVPCVEVNALMKTLKMRPLMFPLAGSVSAIFNCQGPLDAPLFVGSGIVSRKASYLVSTPHPSSALEAMTKNKEAGAVAAVDHIPFSHISANFTFNLDNSVVDFYGIKATLLDGGEIRGAGIAWICPELDAMGRADENLSVEVIGPLSQRTNDTSYSNKSLSISLQKGQLKANICYQPQHSANLEIKNLPLDELELASLRGSIQRAEIQLNFQKRRGHGILSVLRPKFSGMLGEALDVAARWSGDVITVEKTILQQSSSRYELQGEYVLPGTRDRFTNEKKGAALLKRAMAGHLGSVISSMGRWRMRLEVPGAEVSEMLPLARLLSRSTDPAVQSRSKEFFMQCLQSDGFHAEGLRDLLEEIQNHYKWSEDNILEEVTLPGLAEFKGHWRGSLDASGGGNGDTMADFDFNGEDWEWGTYKTQRVIASGAYSNNNGLRLEKLFIQKENATLHADGSLLGPVSNLHFAVLNFPVSLVPTLVQIIESSTADAVHSLRQVLLPIKGILHMEGDLRGNLVKPKCDVQIRLLDGAIGGIDLGRADIVASVTENSRFLFNAHFEPVIQTGHVHVQGSIPVTYSQDDSADAEENEGDISVGSLRNPIWLKENGRGSSDETAEKKGSREKHEEGWNIQLAESLKGLNWNMLDVGEVRINANIKDGGMLLLTALSPYANWLHGFADIDLQVTGTVEQPIVDGYASFHRATVSSPALWKPLTNFGGTVHIISNRVCISSVESRVGRKGKLLLKGNLPLMPSESFVTDKIELKCDFLEVRMKNFFSGQVDSQIQIMGSILRPNISGVLKLSHGEAYLAHDKGNGEVADSLASKRTSFPAAGYSRATASGHISRFFGSLSGSLHSIWPEPAGKHSNIEKLEVNNANPGIDARLTDLKLVLGPELRIVYPLILNFAVSGELELNGIACPQYVKPKGVLMFENGDVNLVATQVRLKRDHLNIAKFEPDLGLDPILDLILVGSEYQFRIQSRASSWQDNLLIISTRSVDQDVLTPSEAARVFESQLAESLLEGDGQLAFKKLATATLETLMPRIEGKGEFGQARWRLVYAPQIPSLLSVDPTVDPLRSLASNISFGTEVEIQLGKRLLASVVRQMKDSEMAMQWTLIYQLTDRLRVLFQSSPSNRLLFEYSAISQR